MSQLSGVIWGDVFIGPDMGKYWGGARAAIRSREERLHERGNFGVGVEVWSCTHLVEN